jgi:peptide/nickel transport system permease protein
MIVGVGAVSIYLCIGVVLGAVAGYYGGTIDTLISRSADAVLCFPSLIIVLVVVAVVGPSTFNVLLAIGLLRWPQIMRIVRGEFLSLRERLFVRAAVSIGTGPYRIITKHLLPNTVAPLTVAATFGVAQAILLEAGLSFLGAGVQPPEASWGNMLLEAQSLTVLSGMPWLWIPPGLMIIIAVLAINFVGDGLRDALDTRSVDKE